MSSSDESPVSRRFSVRRSAAALGAAVAIALGGIAVISPAEAHAAGVRRPLVIQPSSVQVQAVETAPEGGRNDDQ
ncbi:MAG: hypothetical protein E7Z97_08145 [Propionibacteriaceae bacterium]|uniref:Twin arginine translocation (Tat) signal profile n=1 Tax=Propionibacterium ruminifibrarum TaxID=1962131 RepID=A0A375I2G6_9ACTN|nr:hypothetical protein [Propionibacterium ruminifibrarum]MBE6478020.1 hypothetical protein [Propionibacteriaceae bacterium]SPF67859.1 Twin arginine translocation (Tat) signal profile [Propionibacterium ruminifibrarum]